MYKLDIAVWEITLKCNICCLHCGSSADIHSRPKELTTDEALDLIEQLSDLGCKRVVLSGGEPFLRKDWAVLALRIRDLGMNVSFISNGYVVNDDIIDLLCLIDPAGVSFSLDGGCAQTHDYIRGKEGVFERCINALRKTSQRGLYSSAVTSVHKKNIGELPQILDLLIENGVKAWQIQTATPQGRMPKDLALNEAEYYSLAEFIAENREKNKHFIRIMEADCIGYYSKLSPKLEMKQWKGCQAGLRAIGIESDGAIKGCLSLHGDKYIEGRIREKSLSEIWNSKENFKYNRRFSPDLLAGICKDCKWGAVCRGGCSEKAQTFTGTPWGSPFCLYRIESEKEEKV
ncbi:MAG: radical SAM protein [Candidatus Gastranaerophilales bacterium]|nr:radical SAM protein [Candidatus Gastranaerophilales bacterium]